MDLLIAGGTQFVGRHIVEAALARGHKVTLLNRGQSGEGLFPGVERIQADRMVDVSAVKGRRFDSCIDVSGYFHRPVRMLAEAVKPMVPHYCFISTISVYADWREAKAIDETFDLATTDTPDHELRDGKDYGGLKVLAENAAKAVYGEGTLIIRPGLIVGPGDHTNRFTYWPTRLPPAARCWRRARRSAWCSSSTSATSPASPSTWSRRRPAAPTTPLARPSA